MDVDAGILKAASASVSEVSRPPSLRFKLNPNHFLKLGILLIAEASCASHAVTHL